MPRNLLIGCAVSVILPGVALAHDAPAWVDCSSCPGMTWVVTECHFDPMRIGDEEPTRVHSLDELPAEVVARVNAHLEKRLGRDFFRRLRFDQAQVDDPAAFLKEYPDWELAKYPLPTYEIAWRVVFDDDAPVDYCAKLEVDEKGSVIEEIDLPPVARDARLGRVVPLQDIVDLAHSLGVPTDEEYLDMTYNKDSRMLEYLVSYYPRERSEDYNKITLAIRAHDPREFRWYRTLEMY